MYNLSADYMYHIIIRSKNQCQSEDIFFICFLFLILTFTEEEKEGKKEKERAEKSQMDLSALLRCIISL